MDGYQNLSIRAMVVFRTYALRKGDEHDVEDEEKCWTDVLSENRPSIVFGSLAVSSLSPVIVTQT